VRLLTLEKVVKVSGGLTRKANCDTNVGCVCSPILWLFAAFSLALTPITEPARTVTFKSPEFLPCAGRFTFKFSKPVFGFTIKDVNIKNGTIKAGTTLTPVRTDNTLWTLVVRPAQEEDRNSDKPSKVSFLSVTDSCFYPGMRVILLLPIAKLQPRVWGTSNPIG
jgi:hypothetical protein